MFYLFEYGASCSVDTEKVLFIISCCCKGKCFSSTALVMLALQQPLCDERIPSALWRKFTRSPPSPERVEDV